MTKSEAQAIHKQLDKAREDSQALFIGLKSIKDNPSKQFVQAADLLLMRSVMDAVQFVNGMACAELFQK